MDDPRPVSCGGDPSIAELAARANRGEWQSLEAALLAAPSQVIRDVAVNHVVAEMPGRPAWLDTWVWQRPGQHLALLFRGAHGIDWAWQARGGQRAAQTSKQQFAQFHERLMTARADLEMAAQVAPPGDNGALVFQLSLARGLEYEKPKLMALFDEAQSRNPWHPIALASMIQGLAPKWGGSLPAMFDVARAATDEAADGSSAHLAIVQAHFEAASETAPMLYWRLRGVHDDVLRAAGLSIDSPRYVQSPLTLQERNWFLFAYWRVDERERWQRQLELVQGRLTHPFSLSGDPIAFYRAMVKEMSKGTSGR